MIFFSAPFFAALISQDASTVITDDNFPGLVVLAVTGIPAMIFIVRLMVRFQRDFANTYADENRKLRERMVELEEDNERKDQKITELVREQLRYERETNTKIAGLERTVGDHELTILRLNETINQLRGNSSQ